MPYSRYNQGMMPHIEQMQERNPFYDPYSSSPFNLGQGIRVALQSAVAYDQWKKEKDTEKKQREFENMIKETQLEIAKKQSEKESVEQQKWDYLKGLPPEKMERAMLGEEEGSGYETLKADMVPDLLKFSKISPEQWEQLDNSVKETYVNNYFAYRRAVDTASQRTQTDEFASQRKGWNHAFSGATQSINIAKAKANKVENPAEKRQLLENISLSENLLFELKGRRSMRGVDYYLNPIEAKLLEAIRQDPYLTQEQVDALVSGYDVVSEQTGQPMIFSQGTSGATKPDTGWPADWSIEDRKTADYLLSVGIPKEVIIQSKPIRDASQAALGGTKYIK